MATILRNKSHVGVHLFRTIGAALVNKQQLPMGAPLMYGGDEQDIEAACDIKTDYLAHLGEWAHGRAMQVEAQRKFAAPTAPVEGEQGE